MEAVKPRAFYRRSTPKALFVLLALLLWCSRGYAQNAPNSTVNVAPNNSMLLSGYVVDKTTGEPLHFASVIRNRAEGTATDAAGHFQLQINRRDTIIVSFIGYKRYRIEIPANYAAPDYEVEVLLEKDVVQLRSVNIAPVSEEAFREEFMQLKVVTEEEKNAQSNLAKIRAQGILGVVPQMDGFDNYRNYVNGPQGVTFLSFSLGRGASKSRGIAPALKTAANPNKLSDPGRGAMPGSKINRWNTYRRTPYPAVSDTTRTSQASRSDTLRRK